MASSYALPSSALPHAHQQHMHSQSQSSINSWKSKSSVSSGGLHAHPEDEDSDHDYARPSSRHQTHGRGGSQASNTSATLSTRRAPPQALDNMSGWTRETTPGGMTVITPGLDSAKTPQPAPSHHDHNHSHHHEQDHHDHHEHHSHHHGHHHGHHDHGHNHAHPEKDPNTARSLFTRKLLPYTARFPIIHAILIEKDSRRIFYFMVYVSSGLASSVVLCN